MDVSGDGNNNAGRPVTDGRDDAVGKGITINGLVILTPLGESFRPEHTHPPGGLEKYFQDNVIGGFCFFFFGFQRDELFSRALTQKKNPEIAALPPTRSASAPP